MRERRKVDYLQPDNITKHNHYESMIKERKMFPLIEDTSLQVKMENYGRRCCYKLRRTDMDTATEIRYDGTRGHKDTGTRQISKNQDTDTAKTRHNKIK